MIIKKAIASFLLFIVAFIITSYIVLNSEYYKTKPVKTRYRRRMQREIDSEIKLVSIVMSKPSDVTNRKNIRETWSHLNERNYFNGFKYKVYFVVAYENNEGIKKVNEENNAYNDMLIINEIQENYENLNQKVILALKYVHCKHGDSWFILKTDTDVVINLKLLVRHLVDIKNKPFDYEGFIVKDSPVIKDKNNKHYEPTNVGNGSKTFQPYAVGSGYVIRTALLPCMLKKLKYSLPYKNEDAYVGALVNSCSGRYFYNSTFYNRKCSYGYNPKNFNADLNHFKNCVFTHGIKTNEYIEKYNRINNIV